MTTHASVEVVMKLFRVTGAWWNPKRQQWIADHGKPITNVTHWMPMPTGGKR